MIEVIGLNIFKFFRVKREKRKCRTDSFVSFVLIFVLNFAFRLIGQLFSIDVLIRYMRQGSLLS